MTNSNQDIQQDLENILKNVAHEEKIKNFDISLSSTSSGNGMNSDFFSGEILNKDNGEHTHVAIKKASMDGFQYKCGIEPFFKTEMTFYAQVFPKLDKFQRENGVQQPFDNIPRFLAGYVDKENMYVAMENLKVRGYVMFNKMNYLDKDHLELIFKTYGKFHALSFSFKRKHLEDYKNISKNDFGFPDIFGSDDLLPFYKIGYSEAMESFDPESEADILAKLKQAGDVEEAMQKLIHYKGDYNCVIHGDCWSNNLLFKYKEAGVLEDIKLLDFQLSYSTTPVFDLLYFFYSGASKEDFDKLDYYLDLYYQSFSSFARELGENPEQLYPMNVLKKEWKKYGIIGVFIACLLWLSKLLDTSEFVKLLGEKGLPREKYWEKWRELMSGVAKGAAFKEKIRNVCLHAIEYGVL